MNKMNKMNPIKIHISIMKESEKGLSYWVKFIREDGIDISPYMSYHMDRAIIEAHTYAEFFGLTVPKLEPIETIGLTRELIDDGYKEAEPFIKFMNFKFQS